MIKIFRQLRYRLMGKGKTSKYLKYAIGEIILVVIGILIAVSINSWNEAHKQKQELLNIYTIVSDDLNNDINYIDKIIQSYKSGDSIFNRILDGKMTKKDYENSPHYTKIITGYPDLTINKRGYNLLGKYNNHSKSGVDSLQIKIMQFYTKQLVDLHANDELIEGDSISNYTDWKNKYAWYSDFITNRDLDGFIDYALSSPNYKNRVANFHFLHHKIYVSILENFNTKAKVILKEIDEKLDKS